MEIGWSEAQWRRLFATATWVVAAEASAVVGIASAVDRYDGHHIESTWVAPTHRQRGVFRALLRALVDRGRAAQDAHDLLLWVLEDNDEARQAYRRLGFVPSGERQRLADDRHELRLPPSTWPANSHAMIVRFILATHPLAQPTRRAVWRGFGGRGRASHWLRRGRGRGVRIGPGEPLGEVTLIRIAHRRVG